jgi:hypothetical protein
MKEKGLVETRPTKILQTTAEWLPVPKQRGA